MKWICVLKLSCPGFNISQLPVGSGSRGVRGKERQFSHRDYVTEIRIYREGSGKGTIGNKLSTKHWQRHGVCFWKPR